MNFHDMETLYINMYLSFVLFKILSVFNEYYKCDTQLYNTLCFASNNINNFLFFNKAYKDVPVYEVPVCEVIEPIKPTVIPYDQRYLEKVRLIPNNYVFSPSETQSMNDKLNEIYIEQQKLQQELNHLQIENPDKEEITDLQKQILTPNDVLEKARDYVINARLDTLINNVIMENTPLGNVIMMYDNNRETFNFYSDNMIPYRYLETVARKYVITYNCRPLYIDMEEELKIYEKKMLEQEENSEKANLTQQSEPKKNVFAKFKSYNTEGKSGHVGKVPGPQNSVQNKDTGANRKVILKDNANRYSCQGKIHNFSIIKRPEKKLLSKKLAMTFATFKQKSGLGNI